MNIEIMTLSGTQRTLDAMAIADLRSHVRGSGPDGRRRRLRRGPADLERDDRQAARSHRALRGGSLTYSKRSASPPATRRWSRCGVAATTSREPRCATAGS